MEERTFPDIESEKIGDYPAIRITFSEEDATLWMLSKAELFVALEQRMEKKAMTKYQFYEIAFKVAQKDSIPAIFKEKDTARSFAVDIFEAITDDIVSDVLSENPYSPTLCIRQKVFEKEAVWRFSGPNICSSPFSNKKTAEQELFEMKGKEEISTEDYTAALALLFQRNDIPQSPPASKNYDA